MDYTQLQLLHTMVVQVVRWSDASYLEDQVRFRACLLEASVIAVFGINPLSWKWKRSRGLLADQQFAVTMAVCGHLCSVFGPTSSAVSCSENIHSEPDQQVSCRMVIICRLHLSSPVLSAVPYLFQLTYAQFCTPVQDMWRTSGLHRDVWLQCRECC